MPPRKVIIHLRLIGAPGRNQLNGIFRRLGRSAVWDVRLTQGEAELIEELNATKVGSNGAQGFIISAPVSDEVCAIISKLRVPTVLIDIRSYRIPKRTEAIAFVQNDDKDIGISAAKHLHALGNFRSYAFVHAKDSRPWSGLRQAAFSDFIKTHHATYAVYESNTLSSLEDRQRLTEFLTSLERPAAVFAAWDSRALQILECARAAKIDVPGEMVLLGVDDDILCEHTHPPLASVRPDSELEGYTAAKILDNMFRKRKWEKTTLCPISGISERESASAVAPGAHLVRRALAFIEENKTRAISVADVVRQLGISRRLADKRFQQFQHETILEAITRIRLKEVQRRLKNSNLPIAKIANACGFPDASYLMTLFQRKFGMTMREFRTHSSTSQQRTGNGDSPR